MAQQTLSNGPMLDGNQLKTEISQESQPPKLSPDPPQTSATPQQGGPFLIRPTLGRSDSRQNFQYRPPFPGTNVPSGPQSVGPQVFGGPQSIGPQVLSGPHSIAPQVLSGPQSTGPINSGYQSTGHINSGPQSLSPQVLSGYQPTSPISSGPQSHILGGQQLRGQQPLGVRNPGASQPFVQRGPPLGPGGTSVPPRLPQGSPSPVSASPFNPNQPRPVFRPQTPFPRAPLLAQRPQIYQQNSVPAFTRPRPTLEETLIRSQTLDSSEFENQKHAEDGRSFSADQRPPSAASIGRSFSVTSSAEDGRSSSADQRPPSAASIGRSFSVTSSNPTLERKLTGSQESINISRQSSLENVYKKEETVTPRSESRPGSRMGKITENEKIITNSRPESRGEIINGDLTARLPTKESPNYIIDNASPKEEEPKKKEFELKLAKSNKGDNDSGVDESTQGNDQSCNGDSRSPRKPNKSRTSSTTPTKGRSMSRGSKTPSSLQSPDSAATTPGSAEKKKVPMNKIQVGSAPSPNLKVVKSKIGSLSNANYKPGGGKVKIESKKLDYKNAGSKIENKNDKYVSKGGEKKEVQSARSVRSVTSPTKELCSARSAGSSTSPRKILSQKLEWNAKSKIGSLENTSHKPKGGDKKIESMKLNFKEKAAPKVGSKDNLKHQPGGGDVKSYGYNAESNYQSSDIETKKIELNATSKVGSLDNVKHKPTGGEKKIFDDKDYLKQQKSGKSSMNQSLSGSQHSVQSQEPKAPVADENLNQEH